MVILYLAEYIAVILIDMRQYEQLREIHFHHFLHAQSDEIGN